MILGIVEEEKAWKKQRVIKLNVDDGNCSLSTPEINKKMTISGWNHTTNEYSLMKWHKNNGREWESCVVAVADEVENIEKLSLLAPGEHVLYNNRYDNVWYVVVAHQRIWMEREQCGGT